MSKNKIYFDRHRKKVGKVMKISEMFDCYGFGKIVLEPKPVTGGLMHSMYLVETESKKYAVKKLNPIIMKRKGVYDHIVTSENIGIKLKNIVPVVPAKIFNDEPIITFKGDYYIVFDWHEGKSLFPPHISVDNCSKIGEILGKIHKSKLKIHNLNNEIHEIPMYEWEKYLKLGIEVNSKWVDEVKTIIDSLKRWNKELIKASNVLSDFMVISHRDLDPKNVIWKDGEPLLIDWEAAGYVNPYQELLELLNYWADDGDGHLIKENFEALYNAYKIYNDCSNANWKKVITSGYSGMLGWLDYSFKRSLGLEASSDEEIELGTQQVLGTIKELISYEKKITLIYSWLSNDLE